jgi:hypothetical protein
MRSGGIVDPAELIEFQRRRSPEYLANLANSFCEVSKVLLLASAWEGSMLRDGDRAWPWHMNQWAEGIREGALAADGPSPDEMFRQRSRQAAKVLRGAKPAGRAADGRQARDQSQAGARTGDHGAGATPAMADELVERSARLGSSYCSPRLAAAGAPLRLLVAFDLAQHGLLGLRTRRFVLGGGGVIAGNPQPVRLALEMRMDVTRH